MFIVIVKSITNILYKLPAFTFIDVCILKYLLLQ